jgi:benzoyl-CoA reductase subunit C
VSKILEEVGYVYSDPYLKARQERAKGRKIVGITPMFFPEEMVHASGAMPIILQESNTPITMGARHFHHFFCGVSRSFVDVAVKGELSFLDAFILSDFCFEMRQTNNTLRKYLGKPIFHMHWPLEANETRWMDWCVRRLDHVRTELEKVTGTKITEEAMKNSVALYNKNRGLLREIYQLRVKKPGIISSKEMEAVVVNSMVSPIEESNKYLESLLPTLKKAKGASIGKKLRIFLSAHLCQMVKLDVLELIDDIGAVVVGDDLFTGARFYVSDINMDGKNSSEAFASRYLTQPTFNPIGYNPKIDWPEYVIQQVKEAGAAGVIILLPRNCEPMMINYPIARNKIEQAGIPVLMIETEHEMVSLAGVKTRMQAFIETLSNRKGEA